MSTLDDRAARAKQELDMVFSDIHAPPASGIRRRHRRRIAARATAGVLAAIALVGALAVVVTANGDDAPDVAATPPAVPELLDPEGPALATVEITTTGVDFVPATVGAPTGIVRITLTSGSGTHALRFEDDHVLPGGLDVAATGDSATARIFFPEPGEYRFSCSVPGHRAAGMEGVLVVSGPTKTLAQAEAELETRGADTTATTRTTASPTTGDTGLVDAMLPAPDAPLPETLFAVRDDGTLVELDSGTGAVLRELEQLGDASAEVEEGPGPNIVGRVVLAGDGVPYFEECCEPVICCVHRSSAFGIDPRWFGTSPAAAGSRLAYSVSHQIEIVDLATDTVVHTIDVDGAYNLALSQDASRLAYVTDGLQIIDADAPDTNDAVMVALTADHYTQAVVFLPDDRLLVVEAEFGPDGLPGGAAHYFLVDAVGTTSNAVGLPFGVSDVAVSDAGHVLVAGDDRVLRHWDGAAWVEIARGFYSADW